MTNYTHTWKFARLGGFDQVRIDTGEDIAHLKQLDQKLWVALSCPVDGVEFDHEMLTGLDVDNDGRIRAPEVLLAVEWLKNVLVSLDSMVGRGESVELNAINQTTEQGKSIHAFCKVVLKAIGLDNKSEITLEDLQNYKAMLQSSALNGDGIIAQEAFAGDKELTFVFDAMLKTVGSVNGHDGKPGVDSVLVDNFFTSVSKYLEWFSQAANREKELLLLGENAVLAYDAFRLVEPKIEDFFTRCRLAAYDPEAQGALNPSRDTYVSLAGSSLAPNLEALESLPLAQVTREAQLPLLEGLNPVWVDRLTMFNKLVVVPYSKSEKWQKESSAMQGFLTLANWREIQKLFAQFTLWQQSQPNDAVAALGTPVISQVKPGLQAKFKDLIAQDKSLGGDAETIVALEKMLRLSRGMHSFLNNFVSFRDFYSLDKYATFQFGTLYLDGRSCDLCVKVADIDSHVTLASLSRIFLAYCHCTRPDVPGGIIIAAAFTGGDSDNLIVGRNGIFYDRQGRDWDARIVKIIANPISIKEAFFLPYKRMGRMVGEQLEKFASAKDKAVADNSAAAAATTPGAAGESLAAKPPPFDVGKFAGIFAAIGLAVGAIGTAIASVVTGFLGLPIWQVPLALLGLMLAISGPSMLIAWLKLRQRNVAPLLDASGWAINARAKMNILFGEALTSTPKLPAGSERTLRDPYAEKPTPWKRYVFLFLVTTGLIFAIWWSGMGFKDVFNGIKKLSTPATIVVEAPAVVVVPETVDAPAK
jgi:hypothetical protein